MLQAWKGQLMVENMSVIFTKPSIKVEFRYFRKNPAYWKVQVSTTNFKFGMRAYELSSEIINILIDFVTGCPASVLGVI